MEKPQFTLYENKNSASRRQYPYLLDLQSDLLRQVLSTRLMAPLARTATAGEPIAGLTPLVAFKDIEYVIDIPQMAAIRKSMLGPAVGSLASHRDAIIRAIDRLITGN